jgi:hypothetical protein
MPVHAGTKQASAATTSSATATPAKIAGSSGRVSISIDAIKRTDPTLAARPSTSLYSAGLPIALRQLDTTNNVESVRVPNPAEGDYIIQIRG